MTRRQSAPEYTGPTVRGIDVSKWQGNIANRFEVIARENPTIKFCIARTGDGKDSDAKFLPNFITAKKVGWIPGSYHYFRADRDGKFQADLVTSLLEEANFEPGKDLPPALDFEGGADDDLPGGVFLGEVGGVLPHELVVDEALEFLHLLEKQLGVMPLVYTGQTFHWWLSQARPDLAEPFGEYPLWVPSYSRTARLPADRDGNLYPWSMWTFWQTTGSGRVTGYHGDIDINLYAGSEEDLRKFVAETRTVDPYPGTPPVVDTDAAHRLAMYSALDTMKTHLALLHEEISRLENLLSDE